MMQFSERSVINLHSRFKQDGKCPGFFQRLGVVDDFLGQRRRFALHAVNQCLPKACESNSARPVQIRDMNSA